MLRLVDPPDVPDEPQPEDTPETEPATATTTLYPHPVRLIYDTRRFAQ